MKSKRYHLIFDISGVNSNIINNQKSLATFFQTLVPKINMTILHGPILVKGVPENPGITGFVIIDYSHISVHTFSTTNEALVDIFSCKSFDPETAKKEVLNYFQVKDSNIRFKKVFWG